MHINLSLKVSQWVFMTILELCIKSCPLGPKLHPSFDASSLSGCCRQSNESLLNKGMKYWNSGLSARGARTFIATVHIAGALISWRRQKKKGQGKLSLAPNLFFKLSFMPRWSLGYLLLFRVFWNLIPYVTKQGALVRLFLTLRITLMSNYIITFVFKWSPRMCLRFS
jgi:hypothetical protein